ncbi:hypothetical protein AR687_20200 [Flavobacteriaceae bacterium CRH]|nr:hypothetical protein AR687_20200 [Flavobacteriaceae bacterium CRH]
MQRHTVFIFWAFFFCFIPDLLLQTAALASIAQKDREQKTAPNSNSKLFKIQITNYKIVAHISFDFAQPNKS